MADRHFQETKMERETFFQICVIISLLWSFRSQRKMDSRKIGLNFVASSLKGMKTGWPLSFWEGRIRLSLK